MKKISCVCILLMMLGFACTNPEKKAQKVLEEFSKELTAITDVENLSTYDLSRRIDEAYARLEENQKKARKELKKAEQKELFDEAFDINEVPIYFSLLETLTNKQLETLENMKGKVWINAETKEALSMFMIDNKNIEFVNLTNKFTYELVNGKIIFKEKSGVSPVYFDLEGTNLNVRNNRGKSAIYTEASIEEIIQGTWNGASGLIKFQKNGKGIYDYYYERPGSYKVNKNKINCIFDGKKITLEYINPLRLTIIWMHSASRDWRVNRLALKGPEALNFLFDGNLKNTEAQKTQVSYTSSSNTKKGNDWDRILDDYEKYFDQYVKLLKKAKNGDISALTEYATMLEKAQSIGSKLEDAKGDLTPKQSARFLKIQEKLLNAASKL